MTRRSLINLPSVKLIEQKLGPVFPLYLGALTLFIENAITVDECKAKILKLLPNDKDLHERVIMDIFNLDNKIETPAEIISLSKYKMETVKALGQAERDRLRNVLGNRPPRIKASTPLPALATESSFRFSGELLDENKINDRILAISNRLGLTIGDGCAEFLDRAVKMFIHEKLTNIKLAMNRIPTQNPHHPYKKDEALTEGVFIKKQPLSNILISDRVENIITTDHIVDVLEIQSQRLILYQYESQM